MKRRLFSFCAFLLLLAAFSRPALAQPPIWESNYGPVITDLNGEDDEESAVTLSFAFPYDTGSYTTVYVGTNGCLQLGSLGTDDDLDYDLWAYLEEFLDDAAPILCPFTSDLNLEFGGSIHFNDFGDRAVFTWNEVPTYENQDAHVTFQAQLFATGRIVFGYNGILDDAGEDLIDDLSEGIVVGISSSNGAYPPPIDLTGSPFAAGGTKYQAWCYDETDSCGYNLGGGGKLAGNKSAPPAPRGDGFVTVPGPPNSAFDLDQTNVIFDASGSSILEVPALDRKGLAALAVLLAVAGLVAFRRRG